MITSLKQFRLIKESNDQPSKSEMADFIAGNSRGIPKSWYRRLSSDGSDDISKLSHAELRDNINHMPFSHVEELYNLLNETKVNEGISADSFTKGLISQMQKYLPKDRWPSIKEEFGQIVVTNDFGETATYRIQNYSSNEGDFSQPNIPTKGSVE